MATNTNLGGVFTTDTDGAFSSNVYMSTENVVGIIFDTSVVGGLEKLQRLSQTAMSLS